jgi:hypothetical protein
VTPRREAWDPAIVAVVKAALSAALLAKGFVALSDDDFSRMVIAERFAHAPGLDPSGTSWLPLPFWVAGSAMAALGRTLPVAHGVALALGVLSALLVHRAALWLGASRGAALLGAIVATSIPTAARLGVAFQPEALTTGLVVLGAASLRGGGHRLVVGAAALAAACLCRYDAWPAAAVFAALALLRAVPRRDAGPHKNPGDPAGPSPLAGALSALVAVAAPLAWVLHGVSTHHDALFFFHRVAAYRRALGVAEPALASVVAYPLALVRTEPEVTLAGLFVLVQVWRSPTRRAALRDAAGPALVIASILGFLMLGRIMDGAPTHHEARTLLPVWTAIALGVASALVGASAELGGAVLGTLVVLVPSALLRVTTPVEPTAARAPELSIGAAARAAMPEDARLLVDTGDYGYFAVIAAFGAPERADAFESHDPREPQGTDPFASEAALAARVAASGARWLVVRDEHTDLAARLGSVVAREPGLVLVAVR